MSYGKKGLRKCENVKMCQCANSAAHWHIGTLAHFHIRTFIMLLIYVHHSSPRLQYIASFIFKELLKTAYAITADQVNFKSFDGIKINYSDLPLADDEIMIPNNGLLWETGIKEQQVDVFEVNGNKAFFEKSAGASPAPTGESQYPFDIFAATFYLMSRYEEYLPYEKDKYGRFGHKSSLAWRENFLHIPLVNFWVHDLAEYIHGKFNSWDYGLPAFLVTPTYDVDIAWSYLHKGVLRNTGGTLRSILTLNLGSIFERFRVLTGAADPSDIFGWLDTLHKKYSLSPIYFFLVAEKNSTYDKNVLPSSKGMQNLISKTASNYKIGLHPSFQSSENEGLLKREKDLIEKISGTKIETSRQHYLRFTLPDSYRKYIEAGMQDEHSMGYASSNGFRASVASSFFWYDLENEQQTKLRVHPFCYMDSISVFDKKINREQALNEMKYFYEVCKEVNGTFIPVMHNHLISKNFWPEIYEEVLSS